MHGVSAEPIGLQIGPIYRALTTKLLTFVGSPARAEHEMPGTTLDNFWPIQAAFVVGEPISDPGIPS